MRFFAFLVIMSMASSALADGQCPKGQAANDYDFWEFIENNAVRTADEYAMENYPMATFISAKVGVYYQYGGEFVGDYLVMLNDQTPAGTVFAVLKPNFEFCADPSDLDDERSDLFTVIEAKINGVPF